MSAIPPPLLRAECLVHRRGLEGELAGVSLAVEAGGLTLISGEAAGALLRLLGLLERAEEGELWFDGHGTVGLDDAARLELRNHAYGFLFAEPFLLDSFTVAENVAMPLFKISGLDIEQARVRTAQVLEYAGLAEAADCAVPDLCALDQHKVALARALANAPQVLIAEQAGLQLSARDFRDFASLLREAPGHLGVTVLATSGAAADALAPDRVIRLEDGRITGDTKPVVWEEAETRE